MNELLAQIIAKEVSKPQPVDVPEWGLTVHVKKITAGELAAAYAAKDQGDFHLVHLGVVDANGNKVFATVEEVKGRSPKAVGHLVRAVMDFNGMGADEKKG